jgi:hypothetical protein
MLYAALAGPLVRPVIPDPLPVINPPIFVDAHGDLLVFPTLAEVEASLAPLDVQGGRYRVAYDRDGRLLRVVAREEIRRYLGLFRRITIRTRLVECEHIPTHDGALRSLLLRFIHPVSVPGSDASAHPLAGLIRIPDLVLRPPVAPSPRVRPPVRRASFARAPGATREAVP